ncbi:MAG: 2-hydroxychromene-2-carboxylate isomerase [Gammaproteobacteria bacterium]|jgi:2-hydroxychromene-2-carboxylate isomerase|nr:disulfide bond formation protein DsbA [Gammaproteobacteria bacterium]MDP6095269.1 2-hydroxychromene-2-carboxylate isomerase [Gammaproteobacteria bacterium]|tara:strand:+ start:1263 stop:1868 length:606 start_codon:yes stop_codon:yes gene_type:complete
MTTQVEFHFDFGSPNAYLAHKVIPEIEQRSDIKFTYVPVLIGGVFKATNNKSPMEAFGNIRNKPEYNALETKRFIDKHGLHAFRINPFFPVNTLAIMRGAIFALEHDLGEQYIDLIYRCMWEEQLDMADPGVIGTALSEAGLPAEEIINGLADPAVKKQLIDNTNASVERGNFGSPTFFIGNEMYFGKDKLRDVEEALSNG